MFTFAYTTPYTYEKKRKKKTHSNVDGYMSIYIHNYKYNLSVADIIPFGKRTVTEFYITNNILYVPSIKRQPRVMSMCIIVIYIEAYALSLIALLIQLVDFII